MRLNLGEIDLDKYEDGSWRPSQRLKRDLDDRVNKAIEKDSDILEELNYDNPEIKEDQIYILKTAKPDDRWGSTGRRIELEFEVGMDWEEDVGIYERVCFGRYVAVVKFSQDSFPAWMGKNSNKLFGVMLNPDAKGGVRTDQSNYVAMYERLEYPIYFERGSNGCLTDGYAGSWMWHDSYGNDYGFPTGSVWAKFSLHPLFLNWFEGDPLEVKE